MVARASDPPAGALGPHVGHSLQATIGRLAAGAEGSRASLLVQVRSGCLQVLTSSCGERTDDLVISLERYPELRYVLSRREALVIEDVGEHPATADLRDLLLEVGVRSVAAAPVALPGATGLLRLVSSSAALDKGDLDRVVASARECHDLLARLDRPAVLDEDPVRRALFATSDLVLELGFDGSVTAVHSGLDSARVCPPGQIEGRYASDLLPDLAEWTTAQALVTGRLRPGQVVRRPEVLLRVPPEAVPVAATLMVREDRPYRRIILLSRASPLTAVRELAEQVPLPALVLDPAGNTVVTANHRLDGLTGGRRPDLLGMPLAAAVPDEGQDARIQRADGRWIPVRRFGPVSSPGGSGRLVVLLDLRPQHELARREARLRSTVERKLDELDQLHQRFDQMETVQTEFLSAAAHELKTPLTVIESYVESLLNDLAEGLDDEQLSFLSITHESVLRLRRLVVDLVDLAALSSGKMAMRIDRVELAPALASVLDAMHATAGAAGVRLLQETNPASIPPVRADLDRIHQVLRNLIDNAIRFTPEGGTVTVAAQVEVDSVLLRVKDTGVGIPENQLETIFDEFVQGPRPVEGRARGSGLGLSICRRIIAAMGGRIAAASVPGRGTTFTVTVPRWPREGD